MAELPSSPLTPLYHLDGYRQYFTDAKYWEPFIAEVCFRHSLNIINEPRTGLPGTFPTFIVSDRWVIKFFGPLFGGQESFLVEQAVNQLIQPPDFPVPAMLASGYLFPAGINEFSWPYLIFEYIPYPSIGVVFDQVNYSARRSLAHQLGGLLKRMHSIPLVQNSILSSDWQAYIQRLGFLAADCQQRHIDWGSLPSALLAEIPDYLVHPSDLLPPSPSPSLIHTDLTRDHLLGELQGDDWHLKTIIDFGDAISGDLFYELVVLHLEIFDTNKYLLRDFLAAYMPSKYHLKDFTRKVMTLTLLHPYDAFETVFARHPELRSCKSLIELGDNLWNVSFK